MKEDHSNNLSPKKKRCPLIKLCTKKSDEVLKSLIFTHVCKRTCSLRSLAIWETDKKRQDWVDQELFRDKGYIKICSQCLVRAKKHTNFLRVRNPLCRSLELGRRGRKERRENPNLSQTCLNSQCLDRSLLDFTTGNCLPLCWKFWHRTKQKSL